MIDIYSRYIVGVRVHARESGPLAENMMRDVFDVHGVPHVVHADRGTSMTSKPVADLLEDLTVVRSHSRPRVSNDNPYSEACSVDCTKPLINSTDRGPIKTISACRWIMESCLFIGT